MDSPAEKSDRLDAAIAEYLGRVDAGEMVDLAAFLAEHAEIADELRAFLDNQASVASAVDGGQTAHFSHTPHTQRSKGLQIRCPHCSNHVELLVDTPYEEITCHSCGSTFSLVEREDATRQAAPLKSIGRFDLISRLGVGGFGSVWKARDRELDRIVAVKIPRKGQLGTAEIEQFFREARAAAQLRHPNIVPVHEVGREGETIFIVCDLIRGIELSDWLTANKPSSLETAQLCQKIARALHYAHQAGVIHRDLKPSNVMIDVEGQPHLMDFGLAKREVGEITMTVDGQILGTPAYMSPEQAAGRSHWTDRRTDLYSLGVVLFRMLTGELPFRGNAQMQVYQRLTDDPPSPRKLNRHVPRDLETICLKCLERDPNGRFSTAQALAEEFGRFIDGAPIHARPLSTPERTIRWMRRKPALAFAAALTAVLAIGGPIVAVTMGIQERRLAALVVEKDALINQNGVDKGRDAAEIRRLSSALDLWEGRTNPWTLWPPSAADAPRQQLLRALDQSRVQALKADVTNGKLGAWETACGRLALALVAENTGHVADAQPHFSAAEPLLRTLIAEHAGEPGYQRALAQCLEGLSRSLAVNDPGAARRRLAEASGLWKQLAAAGSGVAAFEPRVEEFATQMRLAASAGYDGGGEALAEATRLSQSLMRQLPTDAIGVYELACLLTKMPPAVSPARPGDKPADKPDGGDISSSADAAGPSGGR